MKKGKYMIGDVKNTRMVLIKVVAIRESNRRFKLQYKIDLGVLKRFNLVSLAMTWVVNDLDEIIRKKIIKDGDDPGKSIKGFGKYLIGDIKEDSLELIKVEAGKDKQGKFKPIFNIRFYELEKFGQPDAAMLEIVRRLQNVVKEAIQEYIDGQRKFLDDYQKRLDKVWF